MSVRESLQLVVANAVHVASSRGAKHATQPAQVATPSATSYATTGLNSLESKGYAAMRRATQPQMISGTSATPCSAELRNLIRLCGGAYGFNDTEFGEAMEAATHDPDNALVCFRSIAAQLENK